MPWFLRQLTALGSGDRPTFQSETAPLSTVHCNTNTRALSREAPYLPGDVAHGDAVLLHAVLPSVVRRIPNLICGRGRTVYPPLWEKKRRFFRSFLPQRHAGWPFKTVNGTYSIRNVLISDKLSENCFCNG